MMIEVWKDIFEYSGNYEISNQGRVKSTQRNGTSGGILKPDIVCGYEQVTLYKNNTPKRHKVHRLVLRTFVGESINKVNHKNLNKTDNRLENLEYVTPMENTQHARLIKGNWSPKGERHGGSKITSNDVKDIIKACESKTQRDVAKEYKLSEAQISRIINKRRWNK